MSREKTAVVQRAKCSDAEPNVKITQQDCRAVRLTQQCPYPGKLLMAFVRRQPEMRCINPT